jgi:predicted SAM-dependent methyltransferase
VNLISRISDKIQSIMARRHNTSYGGDKPIYPKTSAGGLKIHLGAGPINIQGWVNIDARKAPHIHLCSEGFSLKEFTDGSISEIYMCHVLEHFSFEEVGSLVKHLRNKLTDNGVLRLSVPDFDKLCNVYQINGENLELIKFALMGGQDYPHNFHKSVFNKESLKKLLQECGFFDPVEWVTEEDFGCDLGDWSNKNFNTIGGSFSISLNMKALRKRDE